MRIDRVIFGKVHSIIRTSLTIICLGLIVKSIFSRASSYARLQSMWSALYWGGICSVWLKRNSISSSCVLLIYSLDSDLVTFVPRSRLGDVPLISTVNSYVLSLHSNNGKSLVLLLVATSKHPVARGSRVHACHIRFVFRVFLSLRITSKLESQIGLSMSKNIILLFTWIYYSPNSGYIALLGWLRNRGGLIHPRLSKSIDQFSSWKIWRYQKFRSARPIISERLIKCAVYSFQ